MKKITIILISGIFLIGFFLMAACREKKEKETLQVSTGADELTILFYADTRMGPFTNWNQKIHKKLIDKILENEKDNGIKYLLFGGDNVWYGFWDKMWKTFFESMNKFKEVYPDIKIFPALGNHELILSEILRKHLSGVDKKYEAITHEDFIKKVEEQLDPKKNKDKSTLFFEHIDKIYPKAQEESLELLTARENETTSWNRFKKYVDAWPHLKNIPNIERHKTYYSFTLPIGNSKKSVKIIVLDSNKKDFPGEQKEWYKNELNFTGGPIITICHHPIFYPETGGGLFTNWNVPPHLFLVGHMHDYERRSLDNPVSKPPVHIISGSGGAPLVRQDPSRCNEPNAFICKKWYNYCRLIINTGKISVTVFGCEKIDDSFTEIDKIEFSF